MKPKHNCCRRTFLKNSLAATAGISLLGAGFSSFTVSDDWDLISYCYFYCSTCMQYKSGTCGGCKSDDIISTYADCSVRACAKNKGLPTCAHCSQLESCDESLWTTWPTQKDYVLRKQEEINSPSGKRENIYKDYFSLYPVPVTDQLTISNSKLLDVEYQLTGIGGKVYKKGNFSSRHYKVDTIDLPEGQYLVSIIYHKKVVYTGKVIKH